MASTIAQSQNKVYLNADTLLLNHLGETSAEQDKQEQAQGQGGPQKGWFA